MRLAVWLGGAALALTSAWAIAQDAPESLLPPGFDRPAPQAPRAQSTPKPQAAPKPLAPQAAPRSVTAPAASTSIPVVQSVPKTSGAGSSASPPAGTPTRTISLDELAKMSPEELEEALNLRPKTDIPAAARRSMRAVGILADDEGGLPAGSLANQDAGLVRAILAHNSGRLVSRWGHILLRRVLVSRLDAPAGMNPADFAALRAALLIRMGEAVAARSLVQDIDTANYSPALSQAAFDAYVRTQDFTGMCPMLTLQGVPQGQPQWVAASAICTAFRGDGNAGLSQLDKQLSRGAMPKIDLLLAQKYAGAAGKARRAVTIEWDGVQEMTPWRYGLAVAVGLTPPAELLKAGGASYDYMGATVPALGLVERAKASDRAAAAGILSSEALVDLYSQIYADETLNGEIADRATVLRDAYVNSDPAGRMDSIRTLWQGDDEAARYARQVLTAYAAARMPVSEDLASDAPGLIASMLAAGLDRNALRWLPLAPQGSEAWALLVLASPSQGAVEAGAVSDFHGDDNSEESRKSAFLVAALAGLGHISPQVAGQLASDMEFNLNRQTRWTRVIDRAADVNNATLVALLAGVGMQGDGWKRMTPLHLMHIVSALQRVGLGAEARMIAAEAVARG